MTAVAFLLSDTSSKAILSKKKYNAQRKIRCLHVREKKKGRISARHDP